jgi:DNA-binding transcriptional ArsR family regulator
VLALVDTKISLGEVQVAVVAKIRKVDQVKVISEPRRREILRLIWDDELSAGQIADRFEVTFGAVSQHLKVLRDAGLVVVRKDGTKRYYQADRAGMGPLASYLESMWVSSLDTLAALAEQAEREKAEREKAQHGKAEHGKEGDA